MARIVEPFIKAHLASWLAGRGAKRIRVSVDGAEPEASSIYDRLVGCGFKQSSIGGGRTLWTGTYERDDCEVTVVSLPGIDMEATLPDVGEWVAECKGEPTDAGKKAGQDRVGFYTAIGQIIFAAGARPQLPSVRVVAVAHTERMVALAKAARGNPIVQAAKLTFLLVDENGAVHDA